MGNDHTSPLRIEELLASAHALKNQDKILQGDGLEEIENNLSPQRRNMRLTKMHSSGGKDPYNYFRKNGNNQESVHLEDCSTEAGFK